MAEPYHSSRKKQIDDSGLSVRNPFYLITRHSIFKDACSNILYTLICVSCVYFHKSMLYLYT